MSPGFTNGFDGPDDQRERHYDVFEEVALIVPYLRKQGVLSAISSQVRLARRRFGHYEVIDFLAVLFGYAISGERTLETFYEQVLPLAQPFMALFERERLPSRSALSRFLASLTWTAQKPCARSFSPICSHARWTTSDTPASLSIEEATNMWSLTSMGRGKLPGNVPCL
jgi:hypothetical protein